MVSRRNKRAKRANKRPPPRPRVPRGQNLSYVCVRRAASQRRIEFASHQASHGWMDQATDIGLFLFKYFVKKYSSSLLGAQVSVPIAAMQIFDLSIDDLVVGSPLLYSTDSKHIFPFAKGRVSSVRFTLSSISGSQDRQGMMALYVIPLNEVEALESVNDLKNEQGYSYPTVFADFVALPGVKSGPMTRPLTYTYVPSRTSWMRDFIRIGSYSETSQARGLPFCRVVLAYHDFAVSNKDASNQTHTYGESSRVTLNITAISDFAEANVRHVNAKLRTTLDPETVGVVGPNGKIIEELEVGTFLSGAVPVSARVEKLAGCLCRYSME